MKRLLDDLASRFDLDYRVRGVRLAELVERFDVDLDDSPLRNFGTPGPADEVASVRQGPVDLHYVPHMFPGLDPKLRLAHRLQYHLLPTEVPAGAPVSIAAVLESYCHLSGDLFGWGMRSDGRFLLWILDVSGHGLETGLVSALVKLIIDTVGERANVDELLAELNEALIGCARAGERELFATGFFIALAPDGGARFCSAGHPPALLRTAEGAVRELSSNALPVGLFPGKRFAMEETTIGPDETLFMYTDGLAELTTRSGEEFGAERLREFLTARHREPKELTETLYRTLAESHDMTQLDDDVSFVAARMRKG